jgi:hypothetical protein
MQGRDPPPGRAAQPDIPNTVCSACGAPVRCGALAGDTTCWCASLPSIAPVPGPGCLCPQCLAARAPDEAG